MGKLSVGKKVPNFKVASTSGTFDLQGHNGKYLVLYFYPKDNTPGCTREGQDFRDLYSEFKKNNTEIFGISRDTIESHKKFKEQQKFPYDLLADVDQTVCKIFSVLDEENSPNKDRCSMIRTTFLLDPQGTLIKEWTKVKVDGHVQEVLDFITELK